MHLVPESLGDDRVGQLDVGGHARRLARRQSHRLDLGEQEAAGENHFGKELQGDSGSQIQGDTSPRQQPIPSTWIWDVPPSCLGSRLLQ